MRQPSRTSGRPRATDGGVVKFRATSSAVALKPGESVSAVVTVVTIPSGCVDATWTIEAKQSNDFSGQPGNDFQPELAASDLVPLGSFDIDPTSRR